jgi:hypothetical protein
MCGNELGPDATVYIQKYITMLVHSSARRISRKTKPTLLVEELRSFLSRELQNSSAKERNMSLVLSHFGFDGTFWPTYEELGAKFQIGTRERVRQIIKKYYDDLVPKRPLPLLNAAAEVIRRRTFWRESELLDVLGKEGFTGEIRSSVGLLQYMWSQGLNSDYQPYLPDLDEVTRANYSQSNECVLVSASYYKGLKKALDVAKSLPGRLGLAEASYIKKSVPKCNIDHVKELIDLNNDTWVLNNNDTFWYSFETRDHVLVNNCEKIFALTDAVHIDLLASALANSLWGRVNKFAYPDEATIKAWISQSVLFNVLGSIVRFHGKTKDHTDLEREVIRYFKTRTQCTWPSINEYLLAKGFDGPAIAKAVMNSPLVYVDKSSGRRNFRYYLISNVPAFGDAQEHVADELYEMFRRKLQRLEHIGTDLSVDAKARREQDILREWLFQTSETSDCAICGRSFTTTALVAAHKRKRAICTDAERLDPYIVFPLCLLGCDYLYENGLISVINGVTVANTGSVTTAAEKAIIGGLVGRALHKRWLQGSSSYFMSQEDG